MTLVVPEMNDRNGRLSAQAAEAMLELDPTKLVHSLGAFPVAVSASEIAEAKGLPPIPPSPGTTSAGSDGSRTPVPSLVSGPGGLQLVPQPSTPGGLSSSARSVCQPCPVAAAVQPSIGGVMVNSGDQTFKCAKCWTMRPISLLKLRGNQQNCETCLSNYSSLQYRWKTEKQLKAWWQSLSLTDQAKHFEKKLNHVAGTKRDFDNQGYREYSETKAKSARLAQIMLVPWSVYLRHAIASGSTPSQAAFEFVNQVKNNTVHCAFEQGQWCVPEFHGILIQHGTESASGYSVDRSAQLHTAQQSQQLMAAGAAMVAQTNDGAQKALSQFGIAARPDLPNTQGLTQMHQAPISQAPDPMRIAIANEVVPYSH